MYSWLFPNVRSGNVIGDREETDCCLELRLLLIIILERLIDGYGTTEEGKSLNDVADDAGSKISGEGSFC